MPESDPRPLVLITGAGGLLGTAIGRDLGRDHRVVGIDVDAPDDASDWAGWQTCDLTSDEDVNKAVAGVQNAHGGRVASVIHLAAYYDFSGEDSPLYRDLTVEGTRRLLRALQGLEVEQFVFSSTLLAMQPAESGELLDESGPLQGEWPYPQSKIDTEQVLHEEHGAIPTVVLRIAGVYDDEGHSIPIAQQIRRIYEKQMESVFFPGNPHHGQSFVHLEDVVSCVRCVVEKRAELDDEELFLVAETDVMSYAELQDRIGSLVHGREWPTIRIPSPIAKAGAWLKEKLGDQETFIKPWMVDQADAHYPASNARARERLGWTPKHRLRESLASIVDTLRRDPEAWYREHDLELPDELTTSDAR